MTSADHRTDPLRRRAVGRDADNRLVEVLAARRGVSLRTRGADVREDVGMLTPASPVSVGVAVGMLVHGLGGGLLEASADRRPWKVRAYRVGRFTSRRVHAETLPADAAVDDRVAEILAAYAAGEDPAAG
ncbi:hypothetical protein KC207_15745 [Phycicoccus sp. BSK3Z-2]|uniref:Uncharacterized protein n=1 Tax=Phycicoccus avicenniae TaxID=2828860 RepID=A0A941DC61_9MICO|nr:hypothetical protein [Phycicoccus avicenniae]MBR7744750.1 hypothetical protein [Phycicoccus avicenniae]